MSTDRETKWICSFQRGGVLPLLLMLLATSGLLWLGNTSYEKWNEAQFLTETDLLLKDAKHALVAYALAYSDNYQPSGAGVGHFPCPDLDPVDDGVLSNDGPNPPCGSSTRQIGRLPRQTFTFGSPDPRETDVSLMQKRIEFYSQLSLRDQQPWYVVSSAFVNNPYGTPVNTQTRGTLHVDGQDNIVAIVIAPGVALSHQYSLRPGDAAAYYLEGENADGDVRFSRKLSSQSNDRMAFITAAELLPLMEKRVIAIVVRWLQDFYQEHCIAGSDCYPFAAMDTQCEQGRFKGSLPFLTGNCAQSLTQFGLLDATPLERHWFLRNEWHTLIRYELSPECLRSYEKACSIDVSYGMNSEDRQSVVSVHPGTTPISQASTF